MPIAVDICNSLANIANQLEKNILGYCNDIYPFPIPAGYFTSSAGLCIFRNAEPFPKTARLTNSLAELFGGITYVTTRPPEAEFVTRRWLARHGFPEGEIIFCHWEEKTAAYASLDPHLIIEDDPRVLEMAKRLYVPIIVPKWPYNGHIKGDKIIPVNWTISENRSSEGAVN